MSIFDSRAKQWDKKDIRVNGAKVIADAIKKEIQLTQNMKIIDFGVGTGLLGFEIAKNVQQVYGVDTSAGMIQALEEKNCDELYIIPINQDIITQPLTQKFNGLVSSMTLHHVKEIDRFFETIYNLLTEDGFIAIADLESEDGTFHSNNSGVHHFGFDEKKLYNSVKKAGFDEISIKTINTIKKPHNDFKIFLLTARR